ncbi:(2Fe-2S)-binding protein [Streptomyces sp. NPDC004270]
MGEPQDSPVVCVCTGVTESMLVEAVRRGHQSLSQLRAATGANTGCGDCALDIADVLESVADVRGFTC